MKKGLLLLLAVFSMGMARAQVEVTDVSGMDYALYCQEIQATIGKTFNLPICLKNAKNVTAFQGHITLPEGFKLVEIGELNSERMNKGSQVFEGNDNDGPIFFLATVLANSGFFPDDDVVGYITISVGADVEPGEYPITIDDFKIAGLFDYDAENNAKLNEGSYPDITGEGIVSKVIVNDYIELFDTATELPEADEDVNVMVHRTIKGGEWSTICLPFDMDADKIAEAFGNDVKFADFDSYQETYNEDETEVIAIDIAFNDSPKSNGIEANHPYLIWVKDDISEFRVNNVDINPNEEDAIIEYDNGQTGKKRIVFGTFYGTLSAGKTIEKGDLFLSGNKFYYSNGSTSIKAFRGYFEFVDVLAAVDADVKVNYSIIDSTTGISNVISSTELGKIYSIDGLYLGDDLKNLGKGIYIVNGKKIVK